MEHALFAGDAALARSALPGFMEQFRGEPLLFTPLSEGPEGGDPRAILRVRVAQAVLRALLANLPRLGLLRETYDLLRLARSMEQSRPTRGRGVTEFNQFFQSAYQAVVENVVRITSVSVERRRGRRLWRAVAIIATRLVCIYSRSVCVVVMLRAMFVL